MKRRPDKKTLIRNFSRYAHLYDKYANIQRMIACELIKKVPSDSVTNILEIGCGTGNYTHLLRKRFKCARVKALDISNRMVEIAKRKLQDKGIEFIVGDGEFIELDGEFNLITSNAAFQWFEDLNRALLNYRDMLIKKGIIAFSIFGPETFWELNESLREILDKPGTLSADNFLEKDRLERILKAYFMKASVKEMIIKEEYPSLMKLLSKIKYTGVRGDGLNGSFLWNRTLLNNVEDAYRTRFGGIEATYQIFLCKAIR